MTIDPNGPGHALAMVLAAIDRIDKDYHEYRKEYREAREGLFREVNRIKTNILTGQEDLPLEPPPPTEKQAVA